VAALAGSPPSDLLVRAMGGLRVGPGDLEPVERAGLVRLTGDGPVWRHPLVRAAAAEGTSEEVRQVHAALAKCWSAVPDGQTQWAWHVAEAVVGADEQVAEALASAAAVSASRSAWIEAADAFERASQLSLLHHRRGTWLGQAADAASRGGATVRAARLYDLALGVRTVTDPKFRAHLWWERGRVEHLLGHPIRAYEMLMRAAGLTGGLDAVWAAAEAVFAAMYARRPDLALAAADRASAAANPTDPVQQFLTLHAAGAATALAGRPAAAGASLSAAMRLLLEQRLLEQYPDLLLWAVNAELFLSHPATELPGPVRAALAHMRETGELMWSPRVVRLVAVRQHSAGAWGAAYAGFEDALELSRMSGQRTQMAEALLCLAAVEATRGESRPCTTHLDEAEQLLAGGEVRWLTDNLWHTRGLLQLSTGDPAAAVPWFKRAVELDLEALPDLVEALMSDDRREEAREAVDAYGQDESAKAVVAAALLQNDTDGARCLLATAEAAPCFDAARARYAAAAMLRRAGARQEAREHLRAVADVFAALGAEPWRRRAEDELRACGATLRRQPAGQPLTPSERRVAALVAEGRPNKEVAAVLFLSTKTVEFHLGRAYRKLGVNNRTALASRLARAENA
jgi:DNA-binding CsgD family transcriptional regulator